MVMPKWDDLTLPILKYSKDGKEKKLKDTRLEMEKYFNLSEEEKAERLSSGQLRFANRVGWARSSLTKAGLMELIKKGYAKITPEGLKVLNDDPVKLDNNFLLKYDSYKEFKQTNYSKIYSDEKKPHTKNYAENSSPEEIIQTQFELLNKQLASELYDAIMNNSPQFFEELVVKLLIKMGYGGLDEESGYVTQYVGDNGIDGIINEDNLGLNQIYLQAKRFKDTAIGQPEIQKFAGALDGQKANKGVFITTSYFTPKAKNYAKNSRFKIVLIDMDKLTKLMIKYGLGVSTVQNFEIKKLDLDFFEEE